MLFSSCRKASSCLPRRAVGAKRFADLWHNRGFMARSRRTPAMLVGRCSLELSGHRPQGELKKSQPPSEADLSRRAVEGSAVSFHRQPKPKESPLSNPRSYCHLDRRVTGLRSTLAVSSSVAPNEQTKSVVPHLRCSTTCLGTFALSAPYENNSERRARLQPCRKWRG